MNNEELAREIQQGNNVTENLAALYENNLPLIRKVVKPFTAFEEESDLMQEAYFGLCEAVERYDETQGANFMTYAKYQIFSKVQRYVEESGSVLRLSSRRCWEIIRYKKTIQILEQELFREPTSAEVAERLGVTVDAVYLLKALAGGITSLDTPISDDESLTLCDTVKDDSTPFEDIEDKITEEQISSVLWGIVDAYTDSKEREIITGYYKDNLSINRIAENLGISMQRTHELRKRGLKKLGMGNARREIMEGCEFLDSKAYKDGLNGFKERHFTSRVEENAIEKLELLERYS